MNSMLKLSTVMAGLSSLVLSTGVWAGSSDMKNDPVSDFFDRSMTETTKWFDETNRTLWGTTGWETDWADYKAEDMRTGDVRFLDGVDKGMHVSNDGATHRSYDCMKGDKLTNLHTNKSGIVKGVNRQGTMDVMMPSGKTVRYQYVVFDVKPL